MCMLELQLLMHNLCKLTLLGIAVLLLYLTFPNFEAFDLWISTALNQIIEYHEVLDGRSTHPKTGFIIKVDHLFVELFSPLWGSVSHHSFHSVPWAIDVWISMNSFHTPSMICRSIVWSPRNAMSSVNLSPVQLSNEVRHFAEGVKPVCFNYSLFSW